MSPIPTHRPIPTHCPITHCPIPAPPPPPCPSPRTAASAPAPALIAALVLALAGCTGVPTPAPTLPGGLRMAGPDGKPVTADARMLTAVAAFPTTNPSDPGTFAERGEFPLPNSTRPAGFETYSWQHLLDDAAGTTVRFALRDDDPPRAWVDDWVVDVAAGRYGIDVAPNYVEATGDVVAQLAAEKAAAVGASEATTGTIDLLWIDDASYGALADGGLLYGPWTGYTPSRRYLDPKDDWLKRTFGRDVGENALAWGRTHFVLLHDPTRLPAPPKSWPALWTWIEQNPGRFTYAAPPDPVGSAFVRQACIALADDAAVFSRPYDDATAEAALEPCWAKLDAIGPKLWQQGGRYPQTQAEADDLFAASEIDISMRYGPPPRPMNAGDGDAASEDDATAARAAALSGARAFALEGGMLSRVHFLAIPFNAPNKQGAIVLANFLQDPEAQFAKLGPENWGDPTVIGPHLVPETWQATYAEVVTPPNALAEDVVAAQRMAEPSPAWVEAIDAGWARFIGGGAASTGGAP